MACALLLSSLISPINLFWQAGWLRTAIRGRVPSRKRDNLVRRSMSSTLRKSPSTLCSSLPSSCQKLLARLRHYPRSHGPDKSLSHVPRKREFPMEPGDDQRKPRIHAPRLASLLFSLRSPILSVSLRLGLFRFRSKHPRWDFDSRWLDRMARVGG